MQATLRDAAHDGGHVLGLDVADGDVVEEEQRLGARGEQVVGAHGNQVDAHGVVLVKDLGELELGAHAVGARDEYRVVHALDVGGGEQAAEAADTADDLGAVRGGHALLHEVDGTGALGRVDAGIAIRDLLGSCAHWYSFSISWAISLTVRWLVADAACKLFGTYPSRNFPRENAGGISTG